jgi:signal peptidase I
MEPTLHSGQPFAWQRWDPSREPLRRGEVVILRVNRVLCVKRILALGGDAFWALNRRSESLASALLLPVNTSPRPWTRRFHNLQARRVRIPAGQLFVVGDGTVSCDSRHYGPVPQTEVIGRVLLPGSDPEEGLRQVTWSRPPRRPGEPRG